MKKFFYICLLLVVPSVGIFAGFPFFDKCRAASPIRDYFAPMLPDYEKDIGYIVNTLGTASLGKIGKAKSSLERAGDRIDHIHPLRFLTYIFTHEETKASIHAMQSRGWVWSEFFGGLKDSLEEESNRMNMQIEIVSDFALKVGVPFDILYAHIGTRNWKELVNTLILLIPRNTQKNRYEW